MNLPLRYSPIECCSRNLPALFVFPSTLRFANEPNWRMLLIRLLSGNINIGCHNSGDIILQRANYFREDLRINQRPRLRSLAKDLDVDNSKLLKYLSRKDPKNQTFFAEIFQEISRAIFLEKKNNLCLAFLHLYRILEKISIVLPLMWASKSDNYLGSFADLKAFFGSDKTSEMKAFQNFVRAIVDDAILQTNVTFNFTPTEIVWREEHFRTFKKICADANADIISDSPPDSLEIKSYNLISILITTRNRYYHLLTGVGNGFGFSSIPDPDNFFEDIYENLKVWIFYVIGRVIIYDIRRS